MTQEDDWDQYLGILQSVGDCLDDASEAFIRVRQDPAFDTEDREALNWMSRSLDDYSATIQGLRLAHGRRSEPRLPPPPTTICGPVPPSEQPDGTRRS